MENKIIKIGQKVIFDPLEGVTLHNMGMKERGRREVVGTVVYINEDHRHFTVKYEDGGCEIRTSFKFNDIGTSVRVCEEGGE